MLVAAGAEPAAVLDRYEAIRTEIDREVDRLAGSRQLGSAAEVTAHLAPRRPARVAETAAGLPRPAEIKPRTLAESINATLDQILAVDRRVIIFGEDVGTKGGVYGVTGGLARRHGTARVFDTVLDEQSILGLGLGAGLAGLIPIPEIQYLAYLHNAEDQLRGEGATLPFFSSGRFTNPMVVRVAGLSYQKGFGGHFHNDNAVGVLRDIPGLVIACPARPDDAAGLLRTCVAAAATDATLSVFLEPIALYHRRDLYADGDEGWLAEDRGEHIPIGSARVYRPSTSSGSTSQLTMITFGNGVPMSLRVARRLAERGIAADVLDLRWLAPLPIADVLAAVRRTGRALVVDETRHTGGVGEGVITALIESGFTGPIARVSSEDSFIPQGPAAAARAARRTRHREISHHAGWDGTFMTGTGPLELLGVDHLLTDDERDIQASVREFVNRRVRPNIADWYEHGEIDLALLREAGSLGLLGMHLEGYGCAGTNATAYGLACLELEAGDSGVRSMVSVQGSLAMFAIWKFGSEEQKTTWLPRMAAGEAIGCFGLTEPDFGSNPSGMRTRAKADGDDWVLNGTKAWITNGSVADIAVVWAQTDDGLKGFLVPTDTPGFSAPKITRKLSLRASITSELILEDVRLPADAVLGEVTGLRGPLSCLNEARFGIVFGALGAARDCLETAIEYAGTREVFDRPLAAFQLTQAKLADMTLELQKGYLLALHLGRLKDDHRLEPRQVSLGKLNNVREALTIARECRTILGANGITLEYPVLRHANNLESVLTYEGTSEVHQLIIGQALTGENAFS